MKMKMKNVSVTLLIFVLVEVIWCEGYWKEEREALWGLNSRFGLPLSWQWEGTDCCEWEGVECNPSTGRVAKLDFNDLESDFDGQTDQNLSLSLADLVVFKDLKSLNLSYSDWALDCADSEGLENLEVLDLSVKRELDSFTVILVCLNFLPSLKSLYLSSNRYLSHNRFNVFNDFETLSSKLLRLEVLDISWNYLTNDILPSLEGFTSLKELYLSGNEFDSDNHIQGLCSMLKNLEVLDLSYNNFNDSDIASALSGLSSLKSLNLGYSELTPRSILNISKIRSLEILEMEGNQLNETSFWRLEKDGFTWPPNLQVLKLTSNSFSNEFLSSLSGLQFLKSLDLRSNRLNGLLDISGLLALTSLEILDLSGNEINSFVVPQVSGSKSLNKLDVLILDSNMINGSKLRESLQPFSSIRVLSMNSNVIVGTITAGDFRDLSSLEHLALDDNFSLDNEFFKTIGELTSLKVLSASFCLINGPLPPADWFKLKNLKELDLSQNLFNGSLPSSFLNMTSLQKLEPSYNQFSGQFDSSIASLTSLEYFGFKENQFEVPLSFSPFANHSNLKFIYGKGNKVVLDLQPSPQTWIPKFQLQVLSLPSMTWNDSLPLPRFLLHQNNLTSLDFSNYWFEGGFPHWLLENNTKLTEALLRNCSLSGTMQLPLRSLSGLQRLDVSDNTIIGEIPSKNMSVVYPNLVYVNMSRNHIQGSIPRELGQMKLLRELDLSYNQLSGEIPEDMFKKDMNPYIRNQLSYQLYVLILSNNKFEGPVFTIPTDLEYLSLNDNNFSGELPSNIFDISIISLDVSNNHLVGKIPSFGNTMTNLLELRMSNNSFEGFIPLELAQQPYLLYLDLSQNHLTGIVPSFLNSSLKFIHLSNNHFIGVSKKMFNGSSPVVMLDLNYNEISDNIQDMIQDLSYSKLNFLFLKGNHITGDIPKELCQMKYLTMLDLSHNKFSGEIPPCFGIMPFDNNNLDSSLKLLKGSFFIEERVTEATSRRTAVPRAPVSTKQQKVTASFTSKRNIYIYMGSTLTYMSGIDLSQNKLKGNIPFDIGNLTRIQALNLSHNDLTGQIPDSFSNLVHTESLDLSFNKLSGQIPPKLNNLTFLQVLSVAHNNLSGPIPEGAQFNTFTNTSYEDNPFLCGPPLAKSCHQTPTIIRHKPNYEERSIDMYFFRVSFVVSYTLALLATAAVLYINSYWRQVWFYYMELVSSNCYYFIVDNFCRFCNARNI